MDKSPERRRAWWWTAYILAGIAAFWLFLWCVDHGYGQGLVDWLRERRSL